MSQPRTRNVLVAVGLWTCARVIASLVRVLLIPISNRLIFTGDAGIVASWLWHGFADVLVAPFAAVAFVWVVETKKPLIWVGALAALFLYGGGLTAWRLLAHGWKTPPGSADYIGILVQAIMPALVCIIVGFWCTRRSATSKLAAT